LKYLLACDLTLFLAFQLAFHLASFWHVWQIFEIPYGMWSDIISGILARTPSSMTYLAKIWNTSWHVIWNYFWHFSWYSIWHLIWHVWQNFEIQWDRMPYNKIYVK
jgi:hypothetical protein